MSDTPQLKATVIVATYRSGPELQGLVDSLDAQTLPTTEWEAVFVDDGSPDDTLARLEEIAATRPHFRVTQIENSGWPCRPRNTGIDMARGEYVVFLDHDDQLFPDALRAGVAYARENGADVLNGKEARTYDMSWALRMYAEDVAQEIGRPSTRGAILPANPHKLYRRAFLNEHGIRFRDEGKVLWEDVFFNVDALRHAAVVSTLATTPFYYWHTTPGSGSSTFLRKNHDWWDWFAEVVAACASLDEERLGAERQTLLMHQYRARLVDSFFGGYARRPEEERRLIFDRARSIQAEHYPASFDAGLNSRGRLRADLLRRGEFDLLTELARVDTMPNGVPDVSAARWQDGRVVFTLASHWRTKNGAGLPIRVAGDRVTKALPDELAAAFTPEQLDLTEDVAAATALPAIRSRTTRVSWPVRDSTVTPALSTSRDGSVLLDVTGTAILDPANLAAGAPLPRDIWEISVASSFAGSGGQPLVSAVITPSVRVDADGVAAVFSNKSKHIVIDFDQRANPITQSLVPTGGVRTDGAAVCIEVGIDEIRADGEFATRVEVNDQPRLKNVLRGPLTLLRRRREDPEGPRGWRKVPATLRVRDGVAHLVVTPDASEFLVRLGTFDRDSAGVYEVHRDGVRALPEAVRELFG